MPTQNQSEPRIRRSGTRIERRLGDVARARLPGALGELVMFVLKQGWACLFGGLLLAALLVTRAIWSADWALHRYDALLIFAVLTQGLFLRLGPETWAEARVILLYHLTGTTMEVFKVQMAYSGQGPGQLVSREALGPRQT